MGKVDWKRISMISNVTTLSESEKDWWTDQIKDFRRRYIKPPMHYVSETITKLQYSPQDIRQNIEKLLIQDREDVYNLYLKDEAILNAKLVSHLIDNRKIPNEIFNVIVEKKILNIELDAIAPEKYKKLLSEAIGEYTGAVFPYFYELSLSTTNSRRSRAGKTFESLIEKTLEILEVPFENQSQLGTSFYKEHNLGKKVDLIIPGRLAYEKRRSSCGVISVKTSLRERWQEVVEELNRSNTRHIYLATLDEGISDNQIQLMKNYAITLVVRENEKNTKFKDAGTVESFQHFFNTTIPHLLSAWDEN
jgi:hypothetical protein